MGDYSTLKSILIFNFSRLRVYFFNISYEIIRSYDRNIAPRSDENSEINIKIKRILSFLCNKIVEMDYR